MNCNIIKDLLPLYLDKVCSAETTKAVEEHLTGCPACRSLLDEMRQEMAVPESVQVQAQQEANVLRGVKRKFSSRHRRSVLAVVLAALVALAALTAASDVEKPIPYREGLVTAKLAVDEAFDLYLNGKNYASFWEFFRETEDGYAIYFCFTQTLKSASTPPLGKEGHICIGNSQMTDFCTVNYQVPDSQYVNAIYYLEASQEDYLDLPQMSDPEFAQAAQNAVLLWKRTAG